MTISSLTIVNTNAATQTVQLYVTRSGNSRRIYYNDDLKQWYSADGGAGIVLQPGDSIDGQTTTASAVDYNIDGYVIT